ncbi:Atr3 [Stachybotrys chartarum IBT 40288]|nr:Atr3 [Stachybotrys chartarum IBT 40288]
METLSQRMTSMESVQLRGIAVAIVTASALYYVLPAAISHIQLSALPMLGKTEVVVIPPKLLSELSKSPRTLSAEIAGNEFIAGKYTKVKALTPILLHSITKYLIPSLGRNAVIMSEEVSNAVRLGIPPCNDWTAVKIYPKIMRMVTVSTGRFLVGSELNRSEEYIDTVHNYALDVSSAQSAVHKMHPWLRPLLAEWLPEIRRLRKRTEEAFALFESLIKERMDMQRELSESELPDDLLQWMIANRHNYNNEDAHDLVYSQLGLTFTANHSTASTITNALYTLATMGDLIDVIRDDITQGLEESGGQFTSKALDSMWKFDSFIKETVRMNPLVMSVAVRKVVEPIKLPSGQVIPTGVTLETPLVAVNLDDQIFPNADVFDPMRFYNLRENDRKQGDARDAEFNQLTSSSTSHMSWGFGKHTCPGRAFAAQQIKMILAHIILRYDIKLVGHSTDRYENIPKGHLSLPDPTKDILMKRREI